ncbi:hypothetical protein V7138_12110 [Bacillus sp. JJ1533]|uniref:hypothetical protein n=1 Tax=Bacillus sp. JJ1533 TaxID=3122959 RepID=UPI002FFDEE28
MGCTVDVAIIGGGTYELSHATHAKSAEITYKVLGYPMDFWKLMMPLEMFIFVCGWASICC